MSLCLGLQLTEQLALLRNLYHLVVDNTVCVGDLTEERQKICGNHITVDCHRLIRLDERRKVDLIHIHDVEGFHDFIAHLKTVVTGLETLHGEGTSLEVECHEAVKIFVDLFLVELSVPDATLLEDIHDLTDLRVEVKPSLRVVLHKGRLHCLLGNDEIGTDLCVRTTVEVLEVAAGQKLHIRRDVMMVGLLAEGILFL